MRPIRLLALAVCAALLTACENPFFSSDDNRDHGAELSVGHLSTDPTFQPNPAQLAFSRDGRTLYFAGRASTGTDSSIFAFDLGSSTLKTLVPSVSGLVRIVALTGNDILYSVATGDVRRAGRDRTGSEATAVVGGRGPFVVSNNGRFVAHRLTGLHSEIIDLTTGTRRTVSTGDANVYAVRDDGNEVVYAMYLYSGNPTVATVSTGATRQLALISNGESSVHSVVWVGDTLRALVIAGGRISKPDGDYIGVPVLREVDPDRGTKRDLGTERVHALSPLGWAPAAHRAAAVAWYMCRNAGSSTGPCEWHAHDIVLFEAAEARKIGTVRTVRAISTAVLSADGGRLVYFGDRLMLRVIE